MKKALRLALAFILTTTVLAVAAGIYAPDGSMFVTIANGIGSGLYAPDGSYRVTLTTAIQAIAFIATGGVSASSQADRATNFGTSFDLQADMGAVGGNTTTDTAAFTSFNTTANNSSASVVRLTVPHGTFSITPQSFSFNKSIIIDGADEFGSTLQLTSSTDLSNILGIIRLTAGSSLVLRNITIDVNGDGSATNKAFILNTANGISVILDHARIINGGAVGALPAQLQLVNTVGMPGCSVTSSYFSFTATQNTAGGVLNFGNNVNTGDKCIVTGNTSINAQLIESVGVDNLIVSHNINTGVGYGACFANAPYTDTTKYFSIEYSHNICRDTGVVPDVNGSFPVAVQTWVNGVLVDDNIISNTCAQGISFGGVTDVKNNKIIDPGSCLNSFGRGAGIAAISVNAGGSTVAGNKVNNVNTTNGTVGYADVPAVVIPVAFGVNDFGNMPSGPFFFQGAATFLQQTVVGRSGLPFAMASGSMGNNGAVTGLTALSATYANSYLALPVGAIASATASSTAYNSTTGILTLTFASAPLGASYASGSLLTVSGVTGTGAGVSSLNGTWTVTAVTSSGTVFAFQAPASLVASGLSGSIMGTAAGSYFYRPSSATAGTVFNNLYSSGTPTIPTSPVAFVTTGPGAFAQPTSQQVTTVVFNLPANLLGLNGSIEVKAHATFTSSVGVKTQLIDVGSSSTYNFCLVSASINGNIQEGIDAGFINRGVTNSQDSLLGYSCQPATTSAGLHFGTVDTTALMPVFFRSQLSIPASDQITLESAVVIFNPGQ